MTLPTPALHPNRTCFLELFRKQQSNSLPTEFCELKPWHFLLKRSSLAPQKAATTSLADLLGQHPGIVVSDPKEPDFFNNWILGLDWYRVRFSRTNAVLLDASVSYSMAAVIEWEQGYEKNVPQRISTLSDAKFIYIVRDPADRCSLGLLARCACGPRRECSGRGRGAESLLHDGQLLLS